MPGRYPSAETADQAHQRAILDGDEQWIGVNMEQSRDTLPKGYAALSINKRLRTGRAVDRDGTLTPVWANIHAFPKILGSGVYNNPNGHEVILIATPSEVVMLRCGASPVTVPIPAGVTLALAAGSSEINFSQDFNSVFLQGAKVSGSNVTFVWDGVSGAGFVPIAQSNPLDTTRRVTPPVPWSVDMASRRIFPLSRDELGVTDIGDYTSYDYILGVYRVNAGTADPIVGAYPFSQNFVVVAKKRSLDLLVDFTGNLANAAMQVLSTEVGVSARRAAKMIGGDMIFPYQTGVYRTLQIIENAITVSPQPVASQRDQAGRVIDPIAPLLRRINWNFADQMVAAILAPYYFLAVPLDGSKVNNAVLVYNTVSDAWEGYDTWADTQWQIDNLLVTDYLGTPHLYAINNATKSVHVLYQGRFDITANGEFEIHSIFDTRGYAQVGVRGETNRDAQWCDIGLSTWRPSTTITQLEEQAYDNRVLTPTPITRNRTKYYTWPTPDYVPTNVNDDFLLPGREDYSVSLADQPLYLGSGINLEQQQEKVVRFSLKARNRWVSFRIENTQGRCDVVGILFQAKGKQRDAMRKAA